MEYEPSLEIAAMQNMNRDLTMPEDTFPSHISLAMAYVPYQPFNNLYEPEAGFERGTLFKGLDLPFKGGKEGMR